MRVLVLIIGFENILEDLVLIRRILQPESKHMQLTSDFCSFSLNRASKRSEHDFLNCNHSLPIPGILAKTKNSHGTGVNLPIILGVALKVCKLAGILPILMHPKLIL